ncbi:piwi domain protein, partial [Trichinella nativa]
KVGEKNLGFLKYLSETKYGIITQCVLKKTVIKAMRDRNPDTLYFNLALKVNSKNGGVNNEVSQESDVIRTWMRRGVMFMGIDVNHPGNVGIKSDTNKKTADLEPSVIGVVANCGKSMSDYRMQCRLQSSRQEQLDGVVFKEIILWFLEKYEKNNGILPEHLIVYRDGVSESQFKMVINNEVKVFHKAFKQLKENYNPKLTVIVVTKRHNTKFFKTDISARTPVQQQNIPPGTVVDTAIVSPFLYDFYLCGHQGLLGTSRLSHYIVLLDDNKFDADSIQMLTFALCFTYQKCSRSVSLPSPVYHAHHVATRGKELREKGDKNVEFKEIEGKLKILENISNSMFWACVLLVLFMVLKLDAICHSMTMKVLWVCCYDDLLRLVVSVIFNDASSRYLLKETERSIVAVLFTEGMGCAAAIHCHWLGVSVAIIANYYYDEEQWNVMFVAELWFHRLVVVTELVIL